MHEGIAKTYHQDHRVHTHSTGYGYHNLHQILLEAFVCRSEMTWVALHTFVLTHNHIILHVIILLNIIIWMQKNYSIGKHMYESLVGSHLATKVIIGNLPAMGRGWVIIK